MDAFSLVGKLKLSGTNEVNSQLQKTKTSLEKVQTGLRVVGAAFTAAGVAGLKMASDARKLNADLGQTALIIGVSTKEMRDLVLETSNVTFSLNSVVDTFDILTRAGVRNTEELVKSANAFDALADATSSSAEIVADILIPAFKVFNLELPKTSEELDKFTWLVKNTTIDLAEFSSVMSYVAMYGADLGLTLDDLIAILAALEDRGIGGAEATRLFRTAVTQAADEVAPFNELLGVTQEQIDAYKVKISEAAGLTDKYAEVANEQYGIMDKLKTAWDKLTLVAGSFLTPLEPILAAMTAMGPAMIFLSTKIGENIAIRLKNIAVMAASKVAMVAHTIATKAAAVAMAYLNAVINLNPFVLLATAIGIAVGALLIFRDRVDSRTKEAIEDFQDLATEAKIAFDTIVRSGQEMTEELLIIFTENIGEMFDETIRLIKTRGEETVNALYDVFSGLHTVTEEELGKMSNLIIGIFDSWVGEYSAYRQEALDIARRANEEEREITQAEQDRINELMLLASQEGVKIVSAGTSQMEDLWREMGETVGNISTKTYIRMLTDSRNATNAIIADYKDKNETIEKNIKELVKLGRMDTETAEIIIGNSKAETDEIIRQAVAATKALEIELNKRLGWWNKYYKWSLAAPKLLPYEFSAVSPTVEEISSLLATITEAKTPEITPTEESSDMSRAKKRILEIIKEYEEGKRTLENITSLEFGGKVPGAIGSPQLVLAHGGEEYLGLQNIGKSIGGNNVTINLGVVPGDDVTVRKVARMLKDVLSEDGRRNAFGSVNQGYFFGRSSI